MIPPIFTLLVLAAPEAISPATTADAVLSIDAQWRAIEATPRLVLLGKEFGLGSDGDFERKGAGFGSAVVIGHRERDVYLLTAYHVVGDARDYRCEFWTREKFPDRSRSIPGGEIVVRSEKPDFALIRLPIKDGPLPPELKLARPGQRPKRFPFAATSVGYPFGGRVQVHPETVTGKLLRIKNETAEAFFWQTRDQPARGRSGGPLLDSESRVIGICSAQQDDRGYYTHLDEIQAVLKREKYDWLWTDK